MIEVFSFTQILGYVASLFLLTGYGIKSDKKTKFVLIFSSLFFTWHFYLLGAFAGASICLVNALRNGTSIFFHKSKAFLLFFIVTYVFMGVISFEKFIDLLPLMASLGTCIGMFLFSGIKFRIIIVIAATFWIIYNISVGSIGGTINSIILFFISLITVIRLYKDQAREQYDQNT